MHTEVMKWASIVALLVALLFWPSTANYQLELSLVVTAGAAVVFIQAYQAKNYGLALGFVCIAVLFNPVMPIFHLAGVLSLYSRGARDHAVCDVLDRAPSEEAAVDPVRSPIGIQAVDPCKPRYQERRPSMPTPDTIAELARRS